MRKTLLLFLALALFQSPFAQQASGLLIGNNIACTTTATGDLFNPFEETGVITFEAPAGGGVNSIYAANLWVAGLSSDQQLHLAAETYQFDGQDWFTGPLQSNGSGNTDPDTEAAFNRVWHANAEDVNTHRLYFDALQNNTEEIDFPNGYSIPEWIMEWPGTYNISLGFPPYLAPFMDYNGNGFYDAENGDYPVFCGDQCLFFIFNDGAHNHLSSGGQRMALEVQAMLYSFDDPTNPMLNNTVFMKYKITHRGSLTFHDTYVGMWVDFDLGNNTDDFVATNVKRSAILAYNGDDNDEQNSASTGYGVAPPMQAFQILAGPRLDDDGIDNPLPDDSFSLETNSYGNSGYGFGDGITDNERLGLSSTLYYNNTNNGINGNPSNALNYYNYLRHLNLDGSSILSAGTEIPQAYYYPGTSDPLYLGTNGQVVNPWDETTVGNVPGDRRMLAVCGPFTMEPEEVNTLDGAFVFADDANGGMSLDNIMDERLRQSKLYFNEHLVTCQSPDMIASVGNLEAVRFSFYPNPASSIATITSQEVGQWMLFDQMGKMIDQSSSPRKTHEIDVHDLAPGVYMVRFTTTQGSALQKIVVE